MGHTLAFAGGRVGASKRVKWFSASALADLRLVPRLKRSSGSTVLKPVFWTNLWYGPNLYLKKRTLVPKVRGHGTKRSGSQTRPIEELFREPAVTAGQCVEHGRRCKLNP